MRACVRRLAADRLLGSGAKDIFLLTQLISEKRSKFIAALELSLAAAHAVVTHGRPSKLLMIRNVTLDGPWLREQ